jgi:23S rRNA (uracil1939-C5)-methyltransferase
MIDSNSLSEVHISKLVYGGQGLGELQDGKKAFVWNSLPGEIVKVRIIKQQSTYVEAIAEEIVLASSERIAPLESNYLDTSPWQIMGFESENRYKKDITLELLTRQKVKLLDVIGTTHDENEWHYRNKMEYDFLNDKTGLHIASYQRSSHAKQIVEGSQLAMPCINQAACGMLNLLKETNVQADMLNTIIVRCTQNSEAVASIYTKSSTFPKFKLPYQLKGLRVNSLKSVNDFTDAPPLIYEVGDCVLEDTLLGKQFSYDVDSFFQVNVPVFAKALKRIQDHCRAEEVVDMYSGVGVIGLSVARKTVDLIEVDPKMTTIADINAKNTGLNVHVVKASSERALSYIGDGKTIIFDPPRAGLSDWVTTKVLETKPPQIIYLSCDPATQARDLARLQVSYDITYFEVFNFFPRTPQIETLAILKAKK